MSYIRSIFFLLFFALSTGVYASYILIPMNPDQKDHLKAYGITYWTLTQGGEIWWLLNYEGGSFILPNSVSIEKGM